jgi:cytochrome c553
MMATVAKNLSDEEIQSLGSYLQGLHERSDADAGNAQAATAGPAKAG